MTLTVTLSPVNSPSQDYTHPDDHSLPNYDMNPGFKQFTVLHKPIEPNLTKTAILEERQTRLGT